MNFFSYCLIFSMNGKKSVNNEKSTEEQKVLDFDFLNFLTGQNTEERPAKDQLARKAFYS